MSSLREVTGACVGLNDCDYFTVESQSHSKETFQVGVLMVWQPVSAEAEPPDVRLPVTAHTEREPQRFGVATCSL